MYGHARLSVCLSVAACLHYCTDVTWGMVRGAPLVVRYWADLQSVAEFCCYDNIAPNAKCQRVLVLALCLISLCFSLLHIGSGMSKAPDTRPVTTARRYGPS